MSAESELCEATIKLLRLLANLAMEARIGNALSKNYNALQVL